MTKTMMSGTFAALLLGSVVVGAQQPSGGAQPPTTPPSATQPSGSPPGSQTAQAPAHDSANKITVTGCLQAVPPAPTGTSGSATAANGGSADEGKYVLANVKSGAADATAPSGPTAAHMYRLVANEAALAPHEGKKIEITGTVDQQSAASHGDTATDSSAASPANAPKLIAESARILAPTCGD